MRAAACQKALVPFELLASLSRRRMGSTSIIRNYVEERRGGKTPRGTVGAGGRLPEERRQYAKFLGRRHRPDRRSRGSPRRACRGGLRVALVRRAARRLFRSGGGRGGAGRPRPGYGGRSAGRAGARA